MMIELCEPDPFWKFLLLLLCPYCRRALETSDEHVNLGDSSGQKLSVCISTTLVPQPRSFTGPWQTLIISACPILTTSTAVLLSWINRFTSLSLFVQDLNELILFFSSLPLSSSSVKSEFHYSFSSQCLSAATLTLNGKVSLSVGNADNRLFHN